MEKTNATKTEQELIDDALEKFRNAGVSLDNAIMRFTESVTTLNALGVGKNSKFVTDTITRSNGVIQNLRSELDYITNYISRLK